jgi:hypothetical protein
MVALLHLLGVDDVSGRWYAFWSGAGSDLSYLSVFVVLFRKHNCHVKNCWRIGHHEVGGFMLCHRHRGTPAPAAASIVSG